MILGLKKSNNFGLKVERTMFFVFINKIFDVRWEKVTKMQN